MIADERISLGSYGPLFWDPMASCQATGPPRQATGPPSQGAGVGVGMLRGTQTI